MKFSEYKWLRISLINLLVVATLGVILRYKILFPLPFVDQKHLLHGHSHFAFSGWVSQTIMTLLIAYLSQHVKPSTLKKYNWVLSGNLLTAYGMLVAFPIQGYGLYSILFSTGSILVGFVFLFFYWRDLNTLHLNDNVHSWFKAAVCFNAFSSVGVFGLTFMMVTKVIHQKWYLAAEYFYLHFQYNGWFFFGCMGLFTAYLTRYNIPVKPMKRIFSFFVFAAVPAYFLSALWMDLPVVVYVLVVLSAFAQVIAWLWLINILKKRWHLINSDISKPAKLILFLSAIALTFKLLLQLGSTIPSLSDLAFGFRPIVIGYLHLVLLGVISLFLLGYMFAEKYFILNAVSKTGLLVFATAVIFNEVVLMMQGVAAISYIQLPFVNEMLLFTGIGLFAGGLFLAFSKINNVQK